MADNRKQTVKDRDGGVLYEGEAPTLKEFVEKLVQGGYSLARADLRRRDLSGLDCDGADFSEALLDGADLRGMSARKARFAGASMRGIVAQGLLAEYGDFSGADLSADPDVGARHYDQREEERIPSHLEGARLAFSKWPGAILDDAFFDTATMSRALMPQIRAVGASFRKARMHDVQFSFSELVECCFDEAKLTTSSGIDPVHLPDRTAWATVANCSFADAELDGTVPGFARDRLWSRTLKALAYTASSVAIFAGAHQLHLGEESHLFGDLLASGTTLVLATTGAVVLKDMVAERARDFVEEHLGDVDRKVRNAFEKAIRAAANLRHMVVASVKGPGVKGVVGALGQTRDAAAARGFFSDFRAVDGRGQATVIFADRRHLAVALEALCAGEARHRLQGDLVLVAPPLSEGAPSVIRYRVDGSTSMVWAGADGALVSADYDRDGVLMRADEGAPADIRIDGHIRGFESALMAVHGVDLDYDRDTHHLRAGRDGSILVSHRTTRRIGNPYGAAMIAPDGRAVELKDGRLGGRSSSGTPPSASSGVGPALPTPA